MITASQPLEKFNPDSIFCKHPLLHMDNDTPVKPEHIIGILHDAYGLDEIKDPIERRGILATILYCKQIIDDWFNTFIEPLTVGELSSMIHDFYNGYMSALTGKVARH